MNFIDTDYTEANWRNDEASFDQAERYREARDLQDWQAGDTRPILCDGSGIVDEYYTDVDQTHVIECRGCPACQPIAVEAQAETETASQPADTPAPLWEGVEVEDQPAPMPMQPAAVATVPSIPWTSSITSGRGYNPRYARIGNGLYVRNGNTRRSA